MIKRPALCLLGYCMSEAMVYIISLGCLANEYKGLTMDLTVFILLAVLILSLNLLT